MTGRGSFRTRAKWSQEEGARGTWVVVITEIPWLVQKSRLVEKIAELLNEKKLPLVGDVRDEFGRRHPPRHRAEIARGRSRIADGIAVPADRAGKPDSAEPQRAGEGPDPQGAGPRRMPARMARPSARRAAAPLQLPQGADRAPARSARRLSDRLSEHRQGDQDHPHRGRAEAGPDQGVQAHRSPGRCHPQHAPARLAQARGNGDPHRGQEPPRRVEGHQGAARLRDRAMGQGRRAGPQGARHLRAEDAARQAPHPVRRRARARSRRDRGSLCRARAGHGRGVRQGLGAHAEGPCRGSLRP